MRAWVAALVGCVFGLCAEAALAQIERPASAAVGVADEGAPRALTRERGKSPAPTQPVSATGVRPAAPALDIKRVAYALGIVLSLILVMRWGGKRLFPQSAGQRASRAVQVLARNVISPKQQLLVIRVGKRLIVVGDSGQQMNALCEITDADEAAALLGQIEGERREPVAIGKTFGSLFGRADAQYNHAEPSSQPGPADDETDATLDQSGDARRDELNGLMDRVRLMSQQFRRT